MKVLAILWLLTISISYAQAQGPVEYAGPRVPVSQSLSNSHISTIVEDQNGYIWIGTRRGLDRFNGSTYKIFNSGDSLSLNSDRILSLMTDTENRLWVGTDAGINMIRGSKIERRAEPGFYPIGAMANFDDGHIVFSTDSGLTLYEKSSGRIIPVAADVGYSEIMLMAEDSLLWVVAGDNRQEIHIYDRTFRAIRTINFDNDLVIHSLLESQGQGVYLLTNNGIYLISQKDYTFQPLPDELRSKTENENIIFAAIDKGRMITGIAEKGIWSLPVGQDGQAIRLWPEEELKYGNDGLCLLAGNNFLYSKNHLNFSIKSLSQDIRIFALYSLKSNEMLQSLHQTGGSPVFAVSNRGIYALQKSDAGIETKIHNYFSGNWIIKDSFLDRECRLWLLCSDNKIRRFKLGSGQFVQDLSTDCIGDGCFFQEADGTVCFIQTGNMIQFLQNGSTKVQILPSSFKCNSAETLPSGRIYLMNEREIYLFTKDRQFIKLPVDIISPNTLAEDNSGRLWIGSWSAGLLCYNPEDNSVIILDKASGLPDESIRSLVPDKNGNIWCATRNEITLINTSSMTATRFQYSTDSQVNFITGSATRDNNGRILFGGMRSVLFINPEIEAKYQNIPITLDAVTINNKEIDLDNKSKLKLSHDENQISFYYSAMNYLSSANLNYSYRLVGYDKDWIFVGNLLQAHYSGIRPGEYTFQVRVQTIDGNWTSPGINQEIRISPSPWASPVMKTIYVILAITFVATVLRYKIRSKMKQAKIDFFTNISHEYRTPLSLIYGPIKELSASTSLSPQDRELVDMIDHNAERLHKLSGQVLDFSRLEKVEDSLEVSYQDISAMLYGITNSFSFQMKQKHLTCNGDFPKALHAWCDIAKLEKIIFNLFSNAVKYTPEGGNITLRAKPSGTDITISVEDTGKGISDERKIAVFKRFKRLENSAQEGGFGVGLNYARHLAILHRAKLKITDNLPHGSVFSLTFAANVEAYSSSEIKGLPKEQAKLEPPQPNSDKSDVNILIVEDNSEMRSYLYRLLHSQFNVSTAENGIIALECIRKAQPDIIISDVVMPMMDGFALCSKLKKDIDTCHIPIILLTAKTDMRNRITGLENGADAYIDKPFDPAFIKAVIQNILENRKRTQQALNQGNKVSIPDDSEFHVSSRDREFMDKVFSLIKEHMEEEDFNITRLAEELHISRSGFFNKMKSLTGASPQEFFISQKLNKALELLKSGKYSVKEVSFMVGFGTLNGFSKAFRNKFGYPPSSIR